MTLRLLGESNKWKKAGYPLIINLFIYLFIISFIYTFIIYSLLQCIDSGKLPLWKNQLAPKIAVNYWNLPVSVWLNEIKDITQQLKDTNFIFDRDNFY